MKFSFEKVKDFLLDKNILLLSNYYFNCRQKLYVRCLICSFEWYPMFYHIKNRNDGCRKCSLRGTKREQINIIFSRKNITCLDVNEYENYKTKLKLLCNICGYKWTGNLKSKCFNCAKTNRKQTCFEKYGVESPLQDKKLMRQGMFEKYGIEHPMYSNIVKDKIKNTCLLIYGVDNPTKNKEIRLKAAKSANKITVLKHWFSREDIPCQGSFEISVSNWLNKNKTDYNWQPQTFLMLDGRTYTPDLYLPDQDLWVEIKGRWYGDAKEKWDWFHKEYPNSEVWDQKRLKKLGII